MRLQVLSSGSEGNSTLVQGGETRLLVDAGLGRVEMEARLESARIPASGIDHVLVRDAATEPLIVWPVERRVQNGHVLSDHAPVELRVG